MQLNLITSALVPPVSVNVTDAPLVYVVALMTPAAVVTSPAVQEYELELVKGSDVTVTVVAVGKATLPRMTSAAVSFVFAQVEVAPQSSIWGWFDTVKFATGVVLVIARGAVPVAIVTAKGLSKL